MLNRLTRCPRKLLLFMVILLVVSLLPAISCAPKGPAGAVVIALDTFGSERWLPQLGNGSREFGGVGSCVFEFLLRWDPGTGELLPYLAESYEVSQGGTDWTFYLRKGVEWHDGWGEFTAEDIKFSYELTISEGSLNILAAPWRDIIQSVEIVNPYQIVFHTKPTMLMGYYVSTALPCFGIVCKSYVDSVGEDEAADHPIGTGPYRFVEHELSNYVRFEALENHWRVVPDFKTLTIKLVPEEASRIAMLRTGEVDLAVITPPSIPDAESAGLNIIMHYPTYSENLLFGGLWLPEHPSYDPNLPWVGPDPENGLKVRKALALAIDKESIIDNILHGAAEPTVAHYFYPGTAQYDPAWEPYPYDPEEAKRLLAEAGYPNGFDVTLDTFPGGGVPATGPMVAEAVAMYWEAIGVRTKLQIFEYATWFAQYRERKAYNPVLWSQGRPEEPIKYLIYNRTTMPYNTYESHELDEILARVQAEMEFDKRTELHKEAGQYIIDNCLCIPIAAVKTVWAATDKISSWPSPMSTRPLDFEYIKG